MANNGDMKIACKSEFPSYAKSRDSAVCLVSMFAPRVDDDKRAPVSITLVLDRSSSMSGGKLQLVKETCKFLLEELGSRDSVSVVSYDGKVRCSVCHPNLHLSGAPPNCARHAEFNNIICNSARMFHASATVGYSSRFALV
jgi:hypothetical protein